MLPKKGLPRELCPEVNSSLCCGICGDILNNPMQSGECGHRFCQDCIEEERKNSVNSDLDCPSCTKEGDTTHINLAADGGDIFIDRGVLRELSRLKVSCIFCKQKMDLKTWKETHLSNCPQRPIPCPKGCGKEVSPSEQTKHFAVCSEAEIPCSLCKKMIKRREMQIHKDEQCDSLFTKCEHCGEQVRSASIEYHHKNECSVSWNKGCPYGCPNVNASNALEHRKNHVAKHIDMVFANSKKDQSSTDSGAFVEVCMKMGELTYILEQTDKRMKEQENLVLQMSRTVQEQELQMCAMRKEIQMLKSSNYNGTLLWRIDRFREKRRAAEDGSQPSIFSPPFFTSQCGYQMCARLYLNGDGQGQNSHLSLFFVLMRGAYDPLLRWPFQQKVTFLLKDQKGRADVVDAFRPDPSGESFKRPTTMMNIASGSPRFLPLTDIDDSSKGYVVDDVMFIRIIVDCSTLV